MFKLNYRSKSARDCREPGPGEARVTILNAKGEMLCRKIGTLQGDDTCIVEWLRVRVKASKDDNGNFSYQVPSTPGEESQPEKEEAAA